MAGLPRSGNFLLNQCTNMGDLNYTLMVARIYGEGRSGVALHKGCKLTIGFKARSKVIEKFQRSLVMVETRK
jgi:hypothetical protein